MDQCAPGDAGDAAVRPVPTDVLGLAREFTDPLWRTTVRLSPVEVDLLRTRPLRRLHFVAHGGASAVCTLQSYSRLEHTLGVLALVARFRPRDSVLRVAALLHDVGHLPLSHTLEGIAGLDHHTAGLQVLRSDPIRSVLRGHRVGLRDVVAALGGTPPTPLTGRCGVLSLDHLDSYVRSGRAAGRLDADPAGLLDGLELAGAAVSADRGTAAVLVGLIRAEAVLHTSWDNVGPVSVVRRLAGRLLHATSLAPADLARMTDQELWAAFDACPLTRTESARIRYEPHRLKVVVGGVTGRETGWDFTLRKIYGSAPLVDRQPMESCAPELAAELAGLTSLPTRFHVRWS